MHHVQVGQAFRDAADEYVRKFLDNGVPSLFSDLKPLYRYALPSLSHVGQSDTGCCAVVHTHTYGPTTRHAERCVTCLASAC